MAKKRKKIVTLVGVCSNDTPNPFKIAQYSAALGWSALSFPRERREWKQKIVVDIANRPLASPLYALRSNYNVESHLLVVSLPQRAELCVHYTGHQFPIHHSVDLNVTVYIKSKVIHSHNLIERSRFIREENRVISLFSSFFCCAVDFSVVFRLIFISSFFLLSLSLVSLQSGIETKKSSRERSEWRTEM